MKEVSFTPQAIGEHRRLLEPYIDQTPLVRWHDSAQALAAANVTSHPERFNLKLELLQRTGTFKIRGAITHLLAELSQARTHGVTAVSAGNHAIAVAYAAKLLGVHAKVVMIRTANPARIAACRAHGAELEFADTAGAAFERVVQIRDLENRVFVHPFDGPHVALGTATLGAEIVEQMPDVDTVIVPVGGGGLCSGVAAAIKAQRPSATVIGVEPTGADTMRRSFQAGSPQRIAEIKTIADSLGAPAAAQYSFDLCRRFVDEVVLVTDDMLRSAMRSMIQYTRLAVEPAGAASTAAALYVLREQLMGKRVCAIVCGSNIDADTYLSLLG
jgi:threonine dehydratase